MASQYRNMSIIKYDIAEDNLVDYTHAYVPLSEFRKYHGEEDFVALEKDGGYIGVKVQNGFSMKKEGPTSYREFVSMGRKNVWILKVAGKNEYADLDEFIANMREIRMDLREDGEVKVWDGDMQYVLDTENVLKVNGEIVHHYPLDVAGEIEFKEG